MHRLSRRPEGRPGWPGSGSLWPGPSRGSPAAATGPLRPQRAHHRAQGELQWHVTGTWLAPSETPGTARSQLGGSWSGSLRAGRGSARRRVRGPCTLQGGLCSPSQAAVEDTQRTAICGSARIESRGGLGGRQEGRWGRGSDRLAGAAVTRARGLSRPRRPGSSCRGSWGLPASARCPHRCLPLQGRPGTRVAGLHHGPWRAPGPVSKQPRPEGQPGGTSVSHGPGRGHVSLENVGVRRRCAHPQRPLMCLRQRPGRRLGGEQTAGRLRAAGGYPASPARTPRSAWSGRRGSPPPLARG